MRARAVAAGPGVAAPPPVVMAARAPPPQVTPMTATTSAAPSTSHRARTTTRPQTTNTTHLPPDDGPVPPSRVGGGRIVIPRPYLGGTAAAVPQLPHRCDAGPQADRIRWWDEGHQLAWLGGASPTAPGHRPRGRVVPGHDADHGRGFAARAA